MLKIRDDVDLKELERFGFEELERCFFKDTNPNNQTENWILRVDKETRKIVYWNFANGEYNDAILYIQDLIKAGLVKNRGGRI